MKAIEVTKLNQVWATDFTYIRMENGFVYLAVILDLFSRRVIGWALSKNIDADLAVSALSMAIERRRPPTGVIHQSDRGVQYLCNKYLAVLKHHGFQISNSAKGHPYDNAFLQSFMKTLKQEEVYNEKRIHSGIDYLTPVEFEEKITAESDRSGPKS